MAVVLRNANIHFVLDPMGLTRIELPAKGKPKVKTVCAIDKKHPSIHGWGAWTSASIDPAGTYVMISRGGHAGSATIALCALEEMAEAAPTYSRDLAGYAGAVLVDDENVLLFEMTEGTPLAQILRLDPACKGGLGKVVQKLEVTGTTLVPAWTTPSTKLVGDELPSFVRIAPDGTWLAVSHTDKKAWGGKLRFANKSWSLEHTFELPLACSTATRIDAACFDGLAMIELFDHGRSEVVVIDVTGAPKIAHQLRIETARPLALTANAVFACAADGDAIVRHALDGGAPRTIAAKAAIEGELFVIGERVYATTRDRFGFVDVESGSIIDRKPPKPVTTLFGLHQLPYSIRPEPFTLQRTEEVFRNCGARAELAGWRVDQPGAPTSHRAMCAVVDTFHDGGVLGCWLAAWVYGQRSRREYRAGDGKTYSFYAQLQRRAVAPSAEHDTGAVLAAFEMLRTNGIRLHEVLHDRQWIVESPYRRRTRPALTPAAIGMLLRAWCSAAARGDLAIPPADELAGAPTAGDVLAAIPKLLPLVIGADDGTLRSANGEGNIDHFIACAFAVLSPDELGEVLGALHVATESFERKRVRATVAWVAKECGISLP